MSTKKFAFVLASMAMLSMLGQARAEIIIKPLSATSTIAGDAGSNVSYLLNENTGSSLKGLQRPLGTLATLETGDSLQDALNTLAELGSSGHEESWTRGVGSGNPVFVFDLGADTLVGSIILWQYGNNGGSGASHTRDFRVILHTATEGSTFSFGVETADLSGTMARIAGTTVNNVAQQFDFIDQKARYVALRIDNNYNGYPGTTGNGDRYGLGEVRLVSGVIPEPATFGIVLSALAALVIRRRRMG